MATDHPQHPPIDWRFCAFEALDVHSLYAALRLRSDVFVVEQRCVFPDLDGADAQAMHLLGFDTAPARGLRAYARCFPAGVKFAEASIGRVVTDPSARGTGLGHRLMAEAIERLHAQWGPQPIRIGAQAHLQAFYAQHGFVVDGPGPYMEDGILHVEMRRPV